MVAGAFASKSPFGPKRRRAASRVTLSSHSDLDRPISADRSERICRPRGCVATRSVEKSLFHIEDMQDRGHGNLRTAQLSPRVHRPTLMESPTQKVASAHNRSQRLPGCQSDKGASSSDSNIDEVRRMNACSYSRSCYSSVSRGGLEWYVRNLRLIFSNTFANGSAAAICVMLQW